MAGMASISCMTGYMVSHTEYKGLFCGGTEGSHMGSWSENGGIAIGNVMGINDIWRYNSFQYKSRY